MRSIHRLHTAAIAGALLRVVALSVPFSASAAGTQATLPAASTQMALRSAEGIPRGIRANGDGVQHWEYAATRSRPPMEVRFDREGRVSGARWLRGGEDFAQVMERRMSMRDALALLGQPDSMEAGPEGVAWRYRTVDSGIKVIQFGADRRVLAVK